VHNFVAVLILSECQLRFEIPGTVAVVSALHDSQLRTRNSSQQIILWNVDQSLIHRHGQPIPAAPSSRWSVVEPQMKKKKEEEKEEETGSQLLQKGPVNVPCQMIMGFIAAEHLGTNQTAAVTLCGEGAEKRQMGDISGAMKLYQRAYKI
jgi:hypothetical protein